MEEVDASWEAQFDVLSYLDSALDLVFSLILHVMKLKLYVLMECEFDNEERRELVEVLKLAMV
jgi:hypothetical protein